LKSSCLISERNTSFATGVRGPGQPASVTQSALSHQLKQIESVLGLPLFMRVRKRLVLTDAGREMLDGARQIVTDISALEDNLRRRLMSFSQTATTAPDWRRDASRAATSDARIPSPLPTSSTCIPARTPRNSTNRRLVRRLSVARRSCSAGWVP
jgi:hypothetical protein